MSLYLSKPLTVAILLIHHKSFSDEIFHDRIISWYKYVVRPLQLDGAAVHTFLCGTKTNDKYTEVKKWSLLENVSFVCPEHDDFVDQYTRMENCWNQAQLYAFKKKITFSHIIKGRPLINWTGRIPKLHKLSEYHVSVRARVLLNSVPSWVNIFSLSAPFESILKPVTLGNQHCGTIWGMPSQNLSLIRKKMVLKKISKCEIVDD